ncbi:uncharacterized protein TM35_000511180 [Trypanosoma theileri]|uniref:Uncharacterized protein n=1 Tax=Trypanosoma theileri TaxID=67003 RepID=A0A1X0NH93_9TRYP|nr:uncharacterized protein TM35_000511180 [Trypanosoma theileri]ORC84017.1 hypothetical protein TM35_000511180 [Trypanosoma theileri]
MMMMNRVMCVLAVVLCCACGNTMTAAAALQPKAVMANTGLPDELKNIVGSEYPSAGEFPYVEKSTGINDYFKKKIRRQNMTSLKMRDRRIRHYLQQGRGHRIMLYLLVVILLILNRVKLKRK